MTAERYNFVTGYFPLFALIIMGYMIARTSWEYGKTGSVSLSSCLAFLLMSVVSFFLFVVKVFINAQP